MRVSLKSLIRFLAVGWFWAFILLALPNCGLDASGIPCENPDCSTDDTGNDCPNPEDPECEEPDPVEAFDPGTSPSDAIFCDFPKPLEPGETDCATS